MHLRRTAPLALVAALVASSSGKARAAPPETEVCATAAEEAQTLKKSGKLTAARDKLIVCARSACPTFVRNDCTQWLEETERLLPSVVIKAVDPKGKDLPHVRVSIDGAVVASKLDGRAIAVDPGEHQMKYEAEGAAPLTETVLIRQGEANRLLSVTLGPGPSVDPGASEPPARSSGLTIPISSWVLGGAGLVAIGVGASFWAAGTADHSEMESGCAKTQKCPREDVAAAQTKLTVGDVAMGVGVVAIGAAIVLAVVAKPTPGSPAAATSTSAASTPPPRRLDVLPVAGGAVASFGARF